MGEKWLFTPHVHNTRKEAYLKNVTEDFHLEFWHHAAGYRKDIIQSLLQEPIIALKDINEDTKVWNICLDDKNSYHNGLMTESDINNIPLPLQEIFHQLYNKNIEVSALNIDFTKVINQGNNIYPWYDIRVWEIKCRLSVSNFEKIKSYNNNLLESDIFTNTSNAWERRDSWYWNSILMKIDHTTTVGQIKEHLLPLIDSLEIQELEPLLLYNEFQMIDWNHPDLLAHISTLKTLYDPYYNIVFKFYEWNSIERLREKLNKWIHTSEDGRKKWLHLIKHYEKTIKSNGFYDIINMKEDIIMMHLLYCHDFKSRTIDYSKFAWIVFHMKESWLLEYYQNIRKEYGQTILENYFWKDQNDHQESLARDTTPLYESLMDYNNQEDDILMTQHSQTNDEIFQKIVSLLGLKNNNQLNYKTL